MLTFCGRNSQGEIVTLLGPCNFRMFIQLKLLKTTNLEGKLTTSNKAEDSHTLWPNNSALSIDLKTPTCTRRDLYKKVHYNLVSSSTKLETLIRGWINWDIIIVWVLQKTDSETKIQLVYMGRVLKCLTAKHDTKEEANKPQGEFLW